jgi:hypothetical protein
VLFEVEEVVVVVAAVEHHPVPIVVVAAALSDALPMVAVVAPYSVEVETMGPTAVVQHYFFSYVHPWWWTCERSNKKPRKVNTMKV